MRGRDSRIEWCVVANALTKSTAEHIERQFQQFSYPTLQLGVYRFMCELRHED